MSDGPPTEDLADLYDNAPCGYLSLDTGSRIVKVNQTLADWLARAKPELEGRSVHELLTFGGKIAFETHLAPLLRLQGSVHEIALDLIGPGNEKIPVIANAAERRDEAGNHLFTRLTMFKAVDRRKYERSLLEARVKAETETRAEQDATVLRDQFIAVLGHDLRNPLAAIGAGVGILSENRGLSDRERKVLGEMKGSLDRANTLIDDVLDFARGRLGGGISLDTSPADDLDEVLEQTAAEIQAVCPECTIETRITLDRPVHCDAQRIGQLAANLLSNAVTHGDADRPIRLEAHCRGEEFRVCVTNHGDPIPEEAMGQLFQPFFRGNVRESQHGLGLGLFIVNEIAEAHGGSMEVFSDQDRTKFCFQMPRKPRS